MKNWIFRISILLNICLLPLSIWNWINQSTRQVGRLESDEPNLFNYTSPKDSLSAFDSIYSTKNQQSETEIPQGSFIYELYFAEFSGRMENVECRVIIEGTNITVVQTENTNLSGKKTIISGIILKHKSGKWIIGQNPADQNAEEIGGCSDGPTPIDFDTKIIEWC